MKSPPNLIVFFTDQQRWDTLGLHGNRQGLTPHFDRLARQGTFFRNGVTPQPLCGPARSCLQTGQYATTTGVWKNGPGLKAESPKLGPILKEAGYDTAYIGKWHLSEDTGPAQVPAENREGYDYWLGANAVELVSGPYSARLWDRDGDEVRLPGYRSDACVDAAIRYLSGRRKQAERPFLLYLSLLEPHHQNTDDSYPPPHGMEQSYLEAPLPPDLRALGGSSARDWAGYCAMIKRIDDGLGRLMDALESGGQAENTIVAFISDHGCHFKTRNGEYKRSPHESSVRVPFALWGPGWDGGGEQSCPASLVDLAPTLLDCAGAAIPTTMQGRSLLPVTRGETGHLPKESYIQFGDGWMPPGRALHTGRWKYAVTASDEHSAHPCAPEYRETHLYDLRSDPYELSNLVESQAHEKILEELRARLLLRIAETGEPAAKILPAENRRAVFAARTIDYPGS